MAGVAGKGKKCPNARDRLESVPWRLAYDPGDRLEVCPLEVCPLRGWPVSPAKVKNVLKSVGPCPNFIHI